jgi:hypothetical protein
VRGLDVTGNGVVNGSDALAVINQINSFGPGPVSAAAMAAAPYFDATDDDNVNASDALAVINFVNSFGSGLPGPAGEPGAEEEVGGQRSEVRGQESAVDEVLALLAQDVAAQPRRRRM